MVNDLDAPLIDRRTYPFREFPVTALPLPGILAAVLLCTFLLTSPAGAQPLRGHRTPKVYDSGGVLSKEQSAYDVLHYRLSIAIDTAARSISGETVVRLRTTDTLGTLVLDLDGAFTVDSVFRFGAAPLPLSFTRPPGRLHIAIPSVLPAGETLSVSVHYRGVPTVALNPPWDGGFVWTRTGDGRLWAGVSCEEEGADLWWPCKDHPSDEPDSMELLFTVPAPLVCVANGILRSVTEGNGVRTYHWSVSEPINNYNVTFYLGPYQKADIPYTSVDGGPVTGEYWFLSPNLATAVQWAPTFMKDLRFLEETCGPFPFRGEKYGLAEAPYWGMEHQTIIAYGNGFRLNSYGFDYIHLHELAHEWWGNLVTAKEWSDAWIHEGFATYMEALFVERMQGAGRYRSYMARMRNSIVNAAPVAPRNPVTARTIFSSSEIYYKGAWILHTFRYLVGDSLFFPLLRRWAYPAPETEALTDGRQCRLATTDEFLAVAEARTGLDLGWFFELYLRQPSLPYLRYTVNDTLLTLAWRTPSGLPCRLPVQVASAGETLTVAMTDGSGSLWMKGRSGFVIDPNGWLLMGPAQVMTIGTEGSAGFGSLSLYPNPFNHSALIRFELPERADVSVTVHDLLGRTVATLAEGSAEAGPHRIRWDGGGAASGMYLVRVRSGHDIMTGRLLLVK